MQWFNSFPLGNFSCFFAFLSSVFVNFCLFFSNHFFLSRIPSECQTDRIHIRPKVAVCVVLGTPMNE